VGEVQPEFRSKEKDKEKIKTRRVEEMKTRNNENFKLLGEQGERRCNTSKKHSDKKMEKTRKKKRGTIR